VERDGAQAAAKPGVIQIAALRLKGRGDAQLDKRPYRGRQEHARKGFAARGGFGEPAALGGDRRARAKSTHSLRPTFSEAIPDREGARRSRAG
jgi:hypothetical protein